MVGSNMPSTRAALVLPHLREDLLDFVARRGPPKCVDRRESASSRSSIAAVLLRGRYAANSSPVAED